MIEYNGPKDDMPVNFTWTIKLNSDFVKELKNDDNNHLKATLVDMFYNELVAWIESTK